MSNGEKQKRETVAHVQMKIYRKKEEFVYAMLQELARTYDIFTNTYPIESKEYNFLCVAKGNDPNSFKKFIEKMKTCAIKTKTVSYREMPAS